MIQPDLARSGSSPDAGAWDLGESEVMDMLLIPVMGTPPRLHSADQQSASAITTPRSIGWDAAVVLTKLTGANPEVTAFYPMRSSSWTSCDIHIYWLVLIAHYRNGDRPN